jgi:hypothetical protein
MIDRTPKRAPSASIAAAYFDGFSKNLSRIAETATEATAKRRTLPSGSGLDAGSGAT